MTTPADAWTGGDLPWSRRDAPAPDARAWAMGLALAEAEAARDEGEVPVGAVIVGPDGAVLGRGRNRIVSAADPTGHAERLAIVDACGAVGAPRLPEGSLLAVTLEPCAMCAGAIVLARIRHLVFGAHDPKTGACGSLRDIVRDERLNHRCTVHEPVAAERSAELLRAFFRPLR